MKKLIQTLTLVFFAAILTACGDGPEKTAKTFFSEMIDGDVNKAAELVYLPPEVIQESAQQGLDEAMLKSQIIELITMRREQAVKEGGIPTAEVGDITYTNSDKTAAKAVITLKKPKSGKSGGESDTLDLIKTDNGWKINLQ